MPNRVNAKPEAQRNSAIGLDEGDGRRIAEQAEGDHSRRRSAGRDLIGDERLQQRNRRSNGIGAPRQQVRRFGPQFRAAGGQASAGSASRTAS
jgi:hypothetical protein